MPRTARKKSKSGIHHIVMRGINKQTIFEDEEDREKYLETIFLPTSIEYLTRHLNR